MKKIILLITVLCICAQNGTNKEQIMHNYYRNKKVLVTGGCGFIGSHIVETLVGYGAQVTILDDLSSGSITNVEPWLDKITFIKGSITDPELCKIAVADVTHVFHLAADISVAHSVEHPRHCYETNVTGTFNMLEASLAAGVKRFVFSSSAAVYGAAEGTCTEDMLCKPLSPYGCSKLIGEQLCWQFYQTHGLETVALRYFNVFGARQNPKGHYAAVVAKFTDQMINNEQITIYGDGLQTRDFVPVEHIVEANVLIGMLPAEHIHERVINVATGQSITLLDLVHKLREKYPTYHQKPIFLPARQGDIKNSYADCTRLFNLYSRL